MVVRPSSFDGAAFFPLPLWAGAVWGSPTVLSFFGAPPLLLLCGGCISKQRTKKDSRTQTKHFKKEKFTPNV